MIRTMERKIEKVEKRKQNQKEEEEKMMSIEKKSLVDFIEGEIMDGLFNEDGDMLVNVSDVTNFSDKEVIKVVEELGLNCEKAEEDGNFWISLSEEFIVAHQNYMDMYFENQDNMNDREMGEFLFDYIQYKKFDKSAEEELLLDTSLWSSFDVSQIIRVAENLGYECQYLGRFHDVNNDPNVGLFKIRKPHEEEEEKMRETEVFVISVGKLEEILPETFEYIKEKFREFVEDPVNSTNAEDYRDWRKYGTVEIVLENGELSYTPVWPKKELPGNDLPWGYDKVENVDADTLKEISKYRIA